MTDTAKTFDTLISELEFAYCGNGDTKTAEYALRAAIDAVVFEAAESMRQYDHQQERACDAEARVAALEAQLTEAEKAIQDIANLGLQRLPVDKRWGTAFAIANEHVARLSKRGQEK